MFVKENAVRQKNSSDDRLCYSGSIADCFVFFFVDLGQVILVRQKFSMSFNYCLTERDSLRLQDKKVN